MMEKSFAHKLRHTPAARQKVSRFSVGHAEQSFLSGCQIVAFCLNLSIKEWIGAAHVLVEDHLSDVMQEAGRVSQVDLRLSGKFCQLAADAGRPTE